MIEIDGSYGEGGGQIIRSSVALSAITGETVRISNLRANRAKPGLQHQHLMAVKAAAQICDAEVVDAGLGAAEFTFAPKAKVQPGEYAFDIGTAGSANLVLQTVLIPLALTGESSSVTVRGGTHNPMAPSAEYLELVYLPVLAQSGIEVRFSCDRHGFYPKGGGVIHAEIAGTARPRPQRLIDRHGQEECGAVVVLSNLSRDVAARGEAVLKQFLPADATVETRIKDSFGPGAAAFAFARYEQGAAGFTSLGEKGKPMEKVAEECGSAFEKWLACDAAVDEHLADQLVLPMCFAEGASRWRTCEVTEHLRTMLWLVTAFLPVSTELEELGDGSGIVQIAGRP